MHPNAPAIRSVLGRSVAEVNRSRQSLRLCHRTFSTTHIRPAEEQPKDEQQKSQESGKPRPKPRGPPSTRHQRSAAAASELGALSKSSPASQGSSGAPSFKKSGFDSSNNKIISFRSLPRKPEDGNNGPRFLARRAPTGDGGENKAGDGGQKFMPRTYFGNAGTGNGPRGRPGARPRLPGRAGAGRPGGKGKAKRAGFKKKKKDGNEDGEGDEYIYSIEEKLWLEAHEQGVQTTYKPSLTKESLLGYGPAVVSTTPVSKVETALRNMRILSGGAPFNASANYTHPEDVSQQVRRNKPVFFSDVKEREWQLQSNDGPEEFTPVHDETKKAIIQAAIQGKHVAPTFATAKDIYGTLAMYHNRDSTYQAEDGKKLDAKVRSLLPLAKDAKAPQKAAKAKA